MESRIVLIVIMCFCFIVNLMGALNKDFSKTVRIFLSFATACALISVLLNLYEIYQML